MTQTQAQTIKQLREDREELVDEILRADKLIEEFLAELQSDKYTGFDASGQRKDWMGNMDIYFRLRKIKEALYS